MSSLDNIKPLMEEYALLKEQEREIQERLKELGEDIRPVLADRGELISNGFSFKCATMKGRTSYDYKLMMADGIDLEPYRKTGAPYTTLTVKKVETI